jgi:putative acyl-CoA dehydrogenase
MKTFSQEPPILKNTYLNDQLLQKLIKDNFLKTTFYKEIDENLTRCGLLAATEWRSLAIDAEFYPPVHVPYDAWGNRTDEIKVSSAWKELENIAAREGIVASAYERKYGASSRVYQMSLLYLYHSSSALFSCPLAMTDGAARLLELKASTPEQKDAFKHLISRDPKNFWTSGQWMTEKAGGSDVSRSETKATSSGTNYYINGTKWFTSATTSQVTMLLAKIENSSDPDKLSLFFVKMRDENNRLNKIEVHRLKDKLGTKALPTAEVTLQGTPAQLIGVEGEGVKSITTILNITRIYNAVCSISQARRGLDLLQDYSQKRMAFGEIIANLPLHKKLLTHLEKTYTKMFKLTFYVVSLLGKEEFGEATNEEKKILRFLTPVLKLYTAKKSYEIISEVVEGFGGAGYVEDTGIPILLRDMMAMVIWEGTTNVLALDLLRALKEKETFEVFCQVMEKSKTSDHDSSWKLFLNQLNGDKEKLQENAREFAFFVADVISEKLC